MSRDSDLSKENFLAPRTPFRGEFSPEHLAFDANLQEFAQRISILCNLETAGKIPPDEAYQRIKQLWNELRESKHNLLDS
ncbi:MAG: hypothetical protein NT070_07860 [Cyanobacteria bacterium]|nr:hypothetical protein [Cyanobacteriota bacterium]